MTSPPATITLDAQVAAWLVAHALSDLWYANQDDGCCPTCCAPCGALQRLLEAGQLDDVVRPYYFANESDLWDRANGRVDREFLAQAWRMTDCHPDEAEG